MRHLKLLCFLRAWLIGIRCNVFWWEKFLWFMYITLYISHIQYFNIDAVSCPMQCIPATIDKERNIWTMIKNTSSMLTVCCWSELVVTCLHCARFTDQLRPDGGTLRRWPDTNTHPHFIIYSPECFIVSGNAVTAYKRLNIGIFSAVSPTKLKMWNLKNNKEWMLSVKWWMWG